MCVICGFTSKRATYRRHRQTDLAIEEANKPKSNGYTFCIPALVYLYELYDFVPAEVYRIDKQIPDEEALKQLLKLKYE